MREKTDRYRERERKEKFEFRGRDNREAEGDGPSSFLGSPSCQYRIKNREKRDPPSEHM